MASKRVARTFVPPACQPGLLGGGEHAASMLRALDDERLNNRCDPEVSSGPRGRRPNPQQYNIVLRYLEGAEATGDRKTVQGFCLGLTGLLALYCAGMCADADDVSEWTLNAAEMRRAA